MMDCFPHRIEFEEQGEGGENNRVTGTASGYHNAIASRRIASHHIASHHVTTHSNTQRTRHTKTNVCHGTLQQLHTVVLQKVEHK
mmetsp:Transcript_6052/g.12701  ORF Transcript_6052/g.12701 Transcript_6052/m.12701 type:complete len:85 (-) Transcript_6052:412-666(-)